VAGILMVLMACESTASVAVQEPTTTTVDPLKAYVLDDPPMSNEHCARVVKLTRDYPRDAGDVPDLGPISLDLAWARNHRELLKRKPGPGIRMI
jgi:hypothetical protein